MENQIEDLPAGPFKRPKKKSGMRIDDLPDLPLEKIFSYLSLEDRTRSRAVSKYWRDCIDGSRIRRLLCSGRPLGFIYEKNHLVSGAFAQNAMSSLSFDPLQSFLATFARSIFSNLKHLRLCHLELNQVDGTEFFTTLNLFDQLEELDIFRFHQQPNSEVEFEFQVNLPMLRRIHLENNDIKGLTLDAPRLLKVKVLECFGLSLDLVHGESVEELFIDYLNVSDLKKLKNLKFLYIEFDIDNQVRDPTFLSTLGQLKEIHLRVNRDLAWILDQKLVYGRLDLKIYAYGLLQTDLDDLVADYNAISEDGCMSYLAKNISRLADKIRLHTPDFFCYAIRNPILRSEMAVYRRFTNLSVIVVNRSLKYIKCFLKIMKSSDRIVFMWFDCSQPQKLFDRLPEHCASLQNLGLRSLFLENFDFLFRFKHLIELSLHSINFKLMRELFAKLEFLSKVSFYPDRESHIAIKVKLQKRIEIWSFNEKLTLPESVSDVDSAIQFLTENDLKAIGLIGRWK